MTSGTGNPLPPPRAFTLVEIVIAITVLAILAGLAVPAIDSVQRERQAREPVNQLALLAREVRGRAMREGRPYQIQIDAQGIRASRFLRPYAGPETAETLRLEREQDSLLRAMMEASAARGIDTSPAAKPNHPEEEQIREGLRYFREYRFPDGIRASLRFWNDIDWQPLSGSEYRNWIFQPSGMCEPLRFRVEAESSFFEVEFHPLTADVKSERSWVE